MQISIRELWAIGPGDAADVAVVIDVLRATTTAAFLLERSPEIIVLGTPAELPTLGDAGRFTVFSELELPPPWHHLDNSPVAARSGAWTGAPVLVTTNGTRAIHAALAVAGTVALAAFVNIGAVAGWLRERAPARVLVVPAGYEPRREHRHEDDACASALIGLLQGTADAGWVAAAAAGCWRDTHVAHRVDDEPGLQEDVELALSVDCLCCVPLTCGREEHVVVKNATASPRS